MNFDVFDDAIARLGGPTKVAEALSTDDERISSQTIVNWRARGAVPANRCKAFEALTGVPVRELRDDWAAYWPEQAVA